MMHDESVKYQAIKDLDTPELAYRSCQVQAHNLQSLSSPPLENTCGRYHHGRNEDYNHRKISAQMEVEPPCTQKLQLDLMDWILLTKIILQETLNLQCPKTLWRAPALLGKGAQKKRGKN